MVFFLGLREIICVSFCLSLPFNYLSLFAFSLWILLQNTREWSRLSLSEEGTWFVLNNNLRTQEFIIAAKFLMKCALNVDVVIRTFKSLWRSQNGFKAKNLGDHILLFIFDNKIEVDKVLLSEP